MRKVTLPTAWDILQPNTIAEMRVLRGFPSIKALSRAIPEMPYARLYKIEKGTCIPRDSELGIIAAVLRTTPERLILDNCTAAEADAWSRTRSGRVQRIRGGDAQAVLLAAAVRYSIRQMRLTTTEILRRADLPWTNYHRLINAEQQVHRWSDRTMAGAMWIMDERTWDSTILKAQSLRDAGLLASYLEQLARARMRLHPDDPDARAPWTDGITRPAVSRHVVETPANRQPGQQGPFLPDPLGTHSPPVRLPPAKPASPPERRLVEVPYDAFMAIVGDMPYKTVVKLFGDAVAMDMMRGHTSPTS